MRADRTNQSRTTRGRAQADRTSGGNRRVPERDPSGGGGSKMGMIAAVAVLGGAGLFGASRLFGGGGGQSANQRPDVVNAPVTSPQASASGAPMQLLIGADVSTSQDEAERKKSYGIMEETVENALPSRTLLQIWTFDKAANPIWKGQPAAARELEAVEDAMAKQKSNAIGTRPAAVLSKMVPIAQEADAIGQPTAIMLLTDGEDVTPKETVEACRALAGLRHFKGLWVVGVTNVARLRAQVDNNYKPLKERLVVSGAFDAAQALEQFRAKL